MQYSSSRTTRDGVETGMVDISDDENGRGGRWTALHKACHGQASAKLVPGKMDQGVFGIWQLQAGAVIMLGAARRGGVLCGS